MFTYFSSQRFTPKHALQYKISWNILLKTLEGWKCDVVKKSLWIILLGSDAL
jgi:hypothetical protein